MDTYQIPLETLYKQSNGDTNWDRFIRESCESEKIRKEKEKVEKEKKEKEYQEEEEKEQKEKEQKEKEQKAITQSFKPNYNEFYYCVHKRLPDEWEKKYIDFQVGQKLLYHLCSDRTVVAKIVSLDSATPFLCTIEYSEYSDYCGGLIEIESDTHLLTHQGYYSVDIFTKHITDRDDLSLQHMPYLQPVAMLSILAFLG